MNSDKALLVIRCLVYNHEPYLRECLDGFVMQKTNFRFVAIVHDDCSTDNSAEIIKEYAQKYPDIIHPIYEKENLYSKKNGELSKVMSCACRQYSPRYFAICEGDDFWTDPLKLQKQVDILEADESLMAVATNAKIVDKTGNTIAEQCNKEVSDHGDKRYNLRDFFKLNVSYTTATVVYRNSHGDGIREKMRKTRNPFFGDWNLWIVLHIYGDFYYLDQVTTAYRINPTSVTHANSNKRRLNVAKANFKILKNISDIIPDDYPDIKKDLRRTDYLWFHLSCAYGNLHRYVPMALCMLVSFVKMPKYTISEIKRKWNRKKARIDG